MRDGRRQADFERAEKSHNGKIKLFDCHGAEIGDPNSDPECVGPPFARQFADEIYTRGYKNCTFYGYLGRVDSFVKDGSPGTHHYIRELEKGKLKDVARASDAGIQFTPTVTFKKPNVFKKLFA